jgi:hypothetical protein
MRATVRKWHLALLADVVDSRSIERFAAWRDKRLRRATLSQRRAGLIRFDYTVTAWDEFQTVAASPRHLYRIAFDLRRRFHPAGLRIGVGIGKAILPRSPQGKLNERAGGEAFILAREAMEELNTRKAQRAGELTKVRCSAPLVEEFANLIFCLQDPLVKNISARQWTAVNALLDHGSQEAAAQIMQVDKSTVSRALNRAHYWKIDASAETAGKLLEHELHNFVQLS